MGRLRRPVEGKTVGVAILNHPDSFRFPTTWHVRTYGLFAANPFGWHDFGMNESASMPSPRAARSTSATASSCTPVTRNPQGSSNLFPRMPRLRPSRSSNNDSIVRRSSCVVSLKAELIGAAGLAAA